MKLSVRDPEKIKGEEEGTIGETLWFPEVLITGIINGSEVL